MPVTITFSSISRADASKLSPVLAKISHDEVVLVELQGSLEVESTHESERNGKLVGKLKIDDSVSLAALLHNIFFTLTKTYHD